MYYIIVQLVTNYDCFRYLNSKYYAKPTQIQDFKLFVIFLSLSFSTFVSIIRLIHSPSSSSERKNPIEHSVNRKVVSLVLIQTYDRFLWHFWGVQVARRKKKQKNNDRESQ